MLHTIEWGIQSPDGIEELAARADAAIRLKFDNLRLRHPGCAIIKDVTLHQDGRFHRIVTVETAA